MKDTTALTNAITHHVDATAHAPKEMDTKQESSTLTDASLSVKAPAMMTQAQPKKVVNQYLNTLKHALIHAVTIHAVLELAHAPHAAVDVKTVDLIQDKYPQQSALQLLLPKSEK